MTFLLVAFLISGLIRLAVLENNTTVSLIHPNRLTIIREPGSGFALNIGPSRTGDSGSYFCLVNGHQEPFSAFQLAIQGNGIGEGEVGKNYGN